MAKRHVRCNQNPVKEDLVIRSTSRFAMAGIAALSVASSVSAWDEYAPVAKGKIEVDLMATYNISPTAGGFTPSLQVKYGIIDGLDVEAFAATPTDPNFGLDRPNIALKYNHAATGLGGFIAVDLPVASDKINADPQTGYTFGAQYLKTFDKIVLNDWAYFASTFQTGDDGKVDVYIKPQYNVTDKIGPYVGVEWFTTGKFEGYTIAVKPGINYIITDVYAVEANLPIAKTKDIDDIYVGAYLGVYGVF